jgi:hypothetical protein
VIKITREEGNVIIAVFIGIILLGLIGIIYLLFKNFLILRVLYPTRDLFRNELSGKRYRQRSARKFLFKK